jgi:hypothetical protein
MFLKKIFKYIWTNLPKSRDKLHGLKVVDVIKGEWNIG